MCLRTAGVRLRLVAGRRLTKPSRSSFPGQLADAESGLNYNYFRDYDPSLGRYIESDPIGLAGGLNTYGYVGGNPVNYADPSGEIVPVLVGIVIGLEVSVAFSIYDNLDNGGWSCIDWTEVAIDIVLGVAIAEGISAISRIPRWAARAARGGRGARPPFASGGRGGYGGAGRGGYGGVGPRAGSGGGAGGNSGIGYNSPSTSTGPNRISSARELLRSAEDTGPFHNFPSSFDDIIFEKGTPIAKGENYIEYTYPGVINGNLGEFQIGVIPSPSGRTQIIKHRFFKPRKQEIVKWK